MHDWRNVADDKPKRCLQHPLHKSRHESALRSEFYNVHRRQRLLDRNRPHPVKVIYDCDIDRYGLRLPYGRYRPLASYLSGFANDGKGYVLLRCEHRWPRLSATERLQNLRRMGILKKHWRGNTCVGNKLKGKLP